MPGSVDVETLAQDDAARDAAARLKAEIGPLPPDALRLLLTEARSHNGWTDRPVSDDILRALYDLVKWGPTSLNMQPARFVFVRSSEGKERLKAALAPGNVGKTMAAPVTVIVAHDLEFWRLLPRTFPVSDVSGLFRDNPTHAEISAFRNATLQGGYLILAARALGLDCGPMSGFDHAKLDDAFFSGTTIRSNFLLALGYADPTKIFRRLPRLAFEEAATLA